MKYLYGLILIAICGGLFFFLRPSDSKRIKKTFTKICTAVSKSTPENPATTALKMLEFGRLCTDSVSINVTGSPIQGTLSNEVLVSHLTRYRGMCETLRLTPLDSGVTILSPEEARCDVAVRVYLKSSFTEFEEVRTCTVQFRKNGKRWQVAGLSNEAVMVR